MPPTHWDGPATVPTTHPPGALPHTDHVPPPPPLHAAGGADPPEAGHLEKRFKASDGEPAPALPAHCAAPAAAVHDDLEMIT